MRLIRLAGGIGFGIAAAGSLSCSSNTGPSVPSHDLTTQLAAGNAFTCALDHAGAAFCWGDGTAGQMGNGSTFGNPVPTKVPGGPYTAISAGMNAVCGLHGDGQVDCWGQAPPTCCGQGGTATSSPLVLVPTPVSTAVRFSQISVGGATACGITLGGDTYCWGVESYGALGNGQRADTALAPVLVSGNHRFVSVAVGLGSGCGLEQDGAAWCWGVDFFGEVGDGMTDTAGVIQPVAVSGGLRFTQISLGAESTCGVTTTGLTECWGANWTGQLGDSTSIDHATPEPVVGGHFVAVFAGAKILVSDDHACALDASGAASCWGDNDDGQLGATTTALCYRTGPFATKCSTTPIPVQGGLSFATLAPGELHTCGMTSDRQIYCWGWDLDHQLGDGTVNDSQSPVHVPFTP